MCLGIRTDVIDCLPRSSSARPTSEFFPGGSRWRWCAPIPPWKARMEQGCLGSGVPSPPKKGALVLTGAQAFFKLTFANTKRYKRKQGSP